jgi:hypothetical protein
VPGYIPALALHQQKASRNFSVRDCAGESPPVGPLGFGSAGDLNERLLTSFSFRMGALPAFIKALLSP